MKAKELIEKLKKCNPEASIVGTTNDHCYNHQLNIYMGFAYEDEYGQWLDVGEGSEDKIPIVQFEFY